MFIASLAETALHERMRAKYNLQKKLQKILVAEWGLKQNASF